MTIKRFIIISTIFLLLFALLYLAVCCQDSGEPKYHPSSEEAATIIWIGENGFIVSLDEYTDEFYGTIEGENAAYPLFAIHPWIEGGNSEKYLIMYDFKSRLYCEDGSVKLKKEFASSDLGYAEIKYTKDDKMILDISDGTTFFTDETIPEKLVFTKYNKDDVDLESLGFDLSFLKEKETE